MPRWTPPTTVPSSEASSKGKKQAAALALITPDAAVQEGLSGEALGSPGGAPEPAVGPPDGGSERCFIMRLRLVNCTGSLPVRPLSLFWFPQEVCVLLRGQFDITCCPSPPACITNSFDLILRMKELRTYFNGKKGYIKLLRPGNVFPLF